MARKPSKPRQDPTLIGVLRGGLGLYDATTGGVRKARSTLLDTPPDGSGDPVVVQAARAGARALSDLDSEVGGAFGAFVDIAEGALGGDDD